MCIRDRDEYYEKFYDWAESTQVRNLSGLTSLGSADEVGEIIIELQVNVPAANRLLRKAVEAKLAFSGSDLVEFACSNDKALAIAAAVSYTHLDVYKRQVASCLRWQAESSHCRISSMC